MTTETQAPIIIFEDAGKAVEVRLDANLQTVWLNLQQLAELFDRDKSVISRHLSNIYKEGELEREATVAKNATVQEEGARRVRRMIELYNLDAIISVGYRVNSSRATRFRQWATCVLREHLTQGWTLNRQRFAENARELEAALVRKDWQWQETVCFNQRVSIRKGVRHASGHQFRL